MPSTIVIRKKLDMTPGAVPTVVHRSQYDSDFKIIFELFARTGEFVIESGTTARLRGTKTSGTGYSVEIPLNISTKTVTITGDAQMTVAAGENIFEVVLYQGDLEICSSNFVLAIERAAMDADTITDETVVPELEHLEEYTQQAAEQAARSASVYAESWAVGGTGTREGEDTNNSKYWSEQAQGAVSGVASFNGRTGVVVPATGDYKSEMIRRGNSATTVEDTLTSLGNTATDLRSRMYTQEGYTSDLRSRMTTEEGYTSDLRTRMSIAENAVSNHSTRLGTAESNIDALEGRATTAESNITTLQNNKVDMTTPLLNFDDTATDPLTDDGALANALRALDILDDVISSGGGSLYLKKALTEFANHFTFGKMQTVTIDTSQLPSGITYANGGAQVTYSKDGKTAIVTGGLNFNIAAGISSAILNVLTDIYLPPRASELTFMAGNIPAFTWNASTGQINLMQNFFVKVNTTGRVRFYMNSVYNNSGVLTRLFMTLPSIIIMDNM